MSFVGGLRRDYQLSVRRDLDDTSPGSQVGDRDATHLRIVFGRNNYLQRSAQRPVAPNELSAIFGETDFIVVRFNTGRLIRSGPGLAALRIAEKDVGSPAVRSEEHT